MLVLLASLAAAAPSVELELVPAARRVPPGQPVSVALLLHVPPGWHIYWENPGQTGLATRGELSMDGAHIGSPQWTAPERIEADGMFNYGYAGEAALVFEVLPSHTGTLEAKASWLLCREVCIPGEGTATTRLAVRDGAHPAGAGPLAPYLPRLPTAFPGDSGGSVTFAGGQLHVELPGPFEVFPSLNLEAAWQAVVIEHDTLVATLPAEMPPDARLVITRGQGSERRAWTLTLSPEPDP